MSGMTYKGYTARIEFDSRDAIFVGRVLGINDIISFHGDNVQALTNAFHEAIDHYLDDCKEAGRKPQKTYSGNLMLRISPQTHAHIAMQAALRGVSINEWAEDVLARAD